MAGIGTISVPVAGPVAPLATFPLTLASGSPPDQDFYYPHTFALLPEGRGAMCTNGIGNVRHFLGATTYGTGLLAPYAAPTSAPSSPAAKAARALTTTGNFTTGDRFDLVSAGDQANYSWPVVITNAFSTSGDNLKYWQILLGASASATLDNIVAAINGTAGDGVTYRSPTVEADTQTADHPAAWSEWITATKTSAAIVTFTAVRYGSVGNTYEAREVTDGGGTWSFPSTVFASGSGGTGASPGSGVYQHAFCYVRTIDDAQSGRSPVVELDQADPGQIGLASMASIAQQPRFASFDAKRWFRSMGDGRSDVLFRGYDVAYADVSDTDDLSDLTISRRGSYDPSIQRLWADGGVPRARCLTVYRGMYVLAGVLRAMDVTVGTVTVTAGSNEATFSTGVIPTRRWEGRTLRIDTDATTKGHLYRVITVTEGGTVYLDRAYTEAGGSGLAYTVLDLRDPFEIVHSEPSLFNNWNILNSIKGITSSSSEGITALATFGGYIVAFTRTGIWFVSGVKGAFSLNHVYEGAGCVGPLAWCEAGGRLWFLSDDGVYTVSASGKVERKSTWTARDGSARGIQATVNRINHARSGYAVAHHDEGAKTVHFFVPLDGEETNRYDLVLDLEREIWGLDTALDITYAATVYTPDGTRRMLVGDIYGDVWEYGVGNIDGGHGTHEPKQVVTGSTFLTDTVGGTPWPTSGNGLKGCPVLRINTTTGVVRRNVVASNTSSVLTYAYVDTQAFNAADIVIVGGIHARIKTAKSHLGQPGVVKVMERLEVTFATDSDGVFYASFAGDQDDTNVGTNTLDDGTTPAYGDFSLSDGFETFWAGVFGRFLQWQIDIFEPGCDPAILHVRPVLRVRSGQYA